MRRAFLSPYGGIGRSDMSNYDELQDCIRKFQSPCGGIGRPDNRIECVETVLWRFQSPHGGIGTSDNETERGYMSRLKFQSPYGGRGRSDLAMQMIEDGFNGFNHLTVAGVGQTGVHKQ